jgi:hypothetical protein
MQGYTKRFGFALLKFVDYINLMNFNLFTGKAKAVWV